MTPFLITVSIAFLLLAVIWTKNNWWNFFIKVFLIGLAVWSSVLLLSHLGYIVRR